MARKKWTKPRPRTKGRFGDRKKNAPAHARAGFFERYGGKLGLLFALIAAVASCVYLIDHFDGLRDERLTRDREVNDLLREAWDLLGGQPGTVVMYRPIRDQTKLELARRRIEEALSLNPKSPHGHFVLGHWLGATGQKEQALDAYQLAFTGEPMVDAVVYNSIGLLREWNQEWGKASDSYRKAFETYPRYYPAIQNLASSLLREGKLGEAETALERARIVGGENPGWYMTKCSVLTAQKRFSEAIVVGSEAVERFPGNPFILNNLGEAYKQAGAFHEAIGPLEEAARLLPDDVGAWTSLAVAQLGAGLAEAAAGSLEIALEADPRDCTALLLMGESLVRLGEQGSDQLIKSWESWCSEQPRSSSVP